MRPLPESAAREVRSSREASFRHLEDRFRLATAASNDCLWDWDLTTGEIHRTDAMVTRFGYSSEEICADSAWWRERIHPDDRDRACESIDGAIAEGRIGSWTCEYRFQRRDGTYAEVCDNAHILKDEAGRPVRMVGAVIDLTEMKEAYRALHESEERYRYTIEMTGQIAWSAAAEGQHAEFGENLSALTGLDRQVTLAEWARVVHPDDLSSALEQWRRSVETGQPFDVQYRLKMLDRTFRWFRSRAAAHKDSAGRVQRWYGTIEDIHEFKSSRLALNRLANFDELTSLPNRNKFSADLQTAFDTSVMDGSSVALLVLDVDDFKSVNDLFGHDVGDLLLKSFARRMLEAGIELYRTGGDEFAIIIQNCLGSETISKMAEQVHVVLEPPFHFGETVFNCRTSIGCAVFPAHGNDPRELLKSADIALYAAKAAGRGQTRVFASTMRSDLQKRSSMIEVARRALAADDVVAFFQPQVSFRNGQLVGFEALMRVRNDRFGPQRPAIIRAAFDHAELSVEIAARMLTKVISVVKGWRDSGLSFGRVAINASPLEFREGKYADRLLSTLKAEGISPEHIEVEVTETVFLERDGDLILQSLRQLKNAGITIALDDFGTGYASLSHLRDYPVDVLKIDRSFIRELTLDPRQEVITKAIISLSRTMGIRTVAEGVETKEQADLLDSFGCDIGQGYLYGHALAAEEAEALLRNRDEMFRTDLENELRAR